jgi:hypothetical protein
MVMVRHLLEGRVATFGATGSIEVSSHAQQTATPGVQQATTFLLDPMGIA